MPCVASMCHLSFNSHDALPRVPYAEMYKLDMLTWEWVQAVSPGRCSALCIVFWGDLPVRRLHTCPAQVSGQAP